MDAENTGAGKMDREGVDVHGEVDARLGTPDGLASFARLEYQRRTFAGRHPLVTFLAGPIFAILGTLAAICLAVFGGGWLIDWATGATLFANDELGLPPSALEMSIVQSASLVVRFVPFALSAWLFLRLGRRAGLPLWSIAACGIVALLAMLFTSIVTPATAHSRASWAMGVGWNWKISVDQMLQAAAPLACCVWIGWQRSTIRFKAVAG